MFNDLMFFRGDLSFSSQATRANFILPSREQDCGNRSIHKKNPGQPAGGQFRAAAAFQSIEHGRSPEGFRSRRLAAGEIAFIADA